MAEKIDPPVQTEPTVVDLPFLEGVDVEVRDEVIVIAGWIDLKAPQGEPNERRIVVRAAMPTMVVRALVRDLRRALARGGN